MALKNWGNSIANLAENIDFKKVGEVKDSAVKGTQQIKRKSCF